MMSYLQILKINHTNSSLMRALILVWKNNRVWLLETTAQLKKCIVTTFLGIIALESGTAEGILNAVVQFLDTNKLQVEKCIGLATDGCNVMCGRNNSVITKFQAVCPRVVHIRCICHSIQLCSSYALKTLPHNIEFMVAETYNWFCHSTVRQQKYKQLYSCINVGEEPLKILKVSDIRWLSIAPCVQRVLDQYEELKLHFQLVKDEECNYTAELLYQMYCTPENKLYLLFLKPILLELNRVNKLFQLDKGSPVKLLGELITLYSTMLLRVVKPTTFSTWSAVLAFDFEKTSNYLPQSAVYFGVEFHLFLGELKMEEMQANNIKERSTAIY